VERRQEKIAARNSLVVKGPSGSVWTAMPEEQADFKSKRECENTCFTIAQARGCGRSMKNL
jgi:hypothetical protein